MNPHLGDYQERPSIDLGRATPASPTHPVNATPLVAIPSRNKSQRKTDEAWAKYFTGEKADPAAEYKQPSPPPAQVRHTRSRSGGSGGFWPGSGAPTGPVAPKFAFRDSAGNTLQTRSVGTSSPRSTGPQEPSTRHYAAAAPKTGRISNANSLSSNGDSEYEDQEVDPAFSSGIPASVQGGHQRDTYSGNWTVTGPNGQRIRSEYNPPPTAFTTNSSGGKSTSTGSSGLGATISNFPMPSGHTTPGGGIVSQVQHPAASHQRSTSRQGLTSGYFPPGALHQGEQERSGVNTDEVDRFSFVNSSGKSANHPNAAELDASDDVEMTNMRPDMLYKYLLDEVGRKQPKVVIKRNNNSSDGAGAVALLEIMDGYDDGSGAAVGATGELVSKNTGLRLSNAAEVRGAMKVLLARARTEKHVHNKGRGRQTTRADIDLHSPLPVAAVHTSEDGSLPPTPHLPAFAATKVARHELLRRTTGAEDEKRLTM
ncbi:uncharacterized protein AB675_5326 [Cyphellophora attinorum]|uniref:Uncharacterized protein n=1 Tax=Cyphellophora attinorum TaxID=1664694 RepID=A0A0N1HT11_9EURO|nr:uncharacterized protein AB675_5326 [Phialophora attinorum]KPI41956.1 hypothetical protein AB675_5326 [Phialophora attinorum]